MQVEQKRGIHVAIIMDGNGRWAERRGLPRTAGHRAGIAAVRGVVENSLNIGIERLTLYAFSSDNWRRPPLEIQKIFWLLRAFLRLETERLRHRGVQLRFIGRRDRLAPAVLQAMEYAESATQKGRQLLVSVAIDYSSRYAITQAAASAAAAQKKQKGASRETLRLALEKALHQESEDVDLLIRTGGEKRLSDFLLWECAYAELFFTPCMWPDFTQADLYEALNEFSRRHRRFGGLVRNENVADYIHAEAG